MFVLERTPIEKYTNRIKREVERRLQTKERIVEPFRQRTVRRHAPWVTWCPGEEVLPVKLIDGSADIYDVTILGNNIARVFIGSKLPFASIDDTPISGSLWRTGGQKKDGSSELSPRSSSGGSFKSSAILWRVMRVTGKRLSWQRRKCYANFSSCSCRDA